MTTTATFAIYGSPGPGDLFASLGKQSFDWIVGTGHDGTKLVLEQFYRENPVFCGKYRRFIVRNMTTDSQRLFELNTRPVFTEI